VPQVRLDLPVLFVRAGLDQPLTNQSFDRRIAAGIAANAPWTVLNYPGGQHGFDVFDDNDLSREIIEETFRFAQLAISGSHQSPCMADSPKRARQGRCSPKTFALAASIARRASDHFARSHWLLASCMRSPAQSVPYERQQASILADRWRSSSRIGAAARAKSSVNIAPAAPASASPPCKAD